MMIVHENMEFHLNVNVPQSIFAKRAQQENSRKRNPFAESESFLTEIRRCCRNCQYMFGIRAATKDLKKLDAKKYIHSACDIDRHTVAVAAGCQKYDRCG